MIYIDTSAFIKLYFPEIDHSALMDSFRQLSRETPRLGCRTVAILHIACALQFSQDHFISFDDRQRALASEAGLSILPPEII